MSHYHHSTTSFNNSVSNLSRTTKLYHAAKKARKTKELTPNHHTSVSKHEIRNISPDIHKINYETIKLNPEFHDYSYLKYDVDYYKKEVERLRSENSRLIKELVDQRSSRLDNLSVKYYEDEINQYKKIISQMIEEKNNHHYYGFNHSDFEKLQQENEINIQLLGKAEEMLVALKSRVTELEGEEETNLVVVEHVDQPKKHEIKEKTVFNHKPSYELESKITQLQHELSLKTSELENYKNQALVIGRLENNLKNLVYENEKNATKLKIINDQNEKLVEELNAKKNQAAFEHPKMSHHQEKTSSHEESKIHIEKIYSDEISRLRVELNEKESAHANLNVIQIKLDEAQIQIEHQKKSLKLLEDEILRLHQELKIENKRADFLLNQNQDYEKKIHEFQSQIQSKQEEVHHFSSKYKLVWEENVDIRNKIVALEATIYKITSENENLKKK